jgi:fluoride exporter
MMQAVAPVAWVFLGGGIGSALRYGVGRATLAWFGPNFPVGTLAVNAIGCFAMGLVAEWLALHDVGVSQETKLFLATGVLGGFTTFSAFALDTAVLWQRGDSGAAVLYVFASLALSVGGLFAGMALLRGG